MTDAVGRFVPPLVIGLVSLGNALAVPTFSNQNQYLAHVIGPRDPELRTDWLVTTADPYPLFTRITGSLFDFGGDVGLRVVAYLATVAALTGVYLIARSLVGGRGVPTFGVLVLGVTLIPWSSAPTPLGSLSAFHGVFEQYLIFKPGYLQPSSAGVLLLPALGLWLGARGRRPRVVAAALLIVAACAIHPTYLVVSGIGLAAALLADLLTGAGPRRVVGYAVVAAASTVAAITANPAMFSTTGGEAWDRLAFERIPHHTLISTWHWFDLAYLVVVGAGALLARPLTGGRWLSIWLAAATVPGLLAAVVVEATRWTPLALVFPSRIVAVAVPVAATVMAARLGLILARLPIRHRATAVIVAALLIGGYGLFTSARAEPPEVADPATVLVRSADPEGVGLIPLSAQGVRLNAEARIYVDWKSPPYVGDYLPEWWRRYDQVSAFERDPESFCTSEWSDGIDWVLLPQGVEVSCLQQWLVRGESEAFVVRQRPAQG